MATKLGVIEVPPGSALVLQDTAYAFSELVLNDKSAVAFASSIPKVDITCSKLTLKGSSTIDLTPKVPIPRPPNPKPGQPQTSNSPVAPQVGARGIDGDPGGAGTAGIDLDMSVQNLDANHGSLWIKTDGTAGGQGGDGGAGGKGTSGPQTCFSNPDGGPGGNGGNGGAGGKGGRSAMVNLKIGPNTISPTPIPGGSAPTPRPPAADVPGSVVIAGSPGPGGHGGRGGAGGPGGEGHESHFPCPTTDSNGGAPGRAGNDGPTG